MNSVQDQAKRALNAYLEAQLGKALVLADQDRIAYQRANFLREFGPERLAGAPAGELLYRLPINLANDRPLDYWLEFRNDAVFDTRLFGSIAGGSAAKFGLWQDKKTGGWRAKTPGSRAIRTLSEHEALDIVELRRREMLAAVAALSAFTDRSPKERDPEAVQAAVAAAAPRWKSSAWLHKYLHLNFPELVAWRATLPYLQADLYRLGVAASGSGLYALDSKLIQFWDSLPALAQVPIPLRYRLTQGLTPRDHWCFRLDEETAAREALLANRHIALGPARVGNLAGLFSLSFRAEIRQGIESGFQAAGSEPVPERLSELLELGYSLKEGSLVALLSDAVTVEAVGEVSGGYRYAFREDYPHQRPVRWLHRQRFRFSTPVERPGGHLVALDPQQPAAAELEASLLANGIGFWPGFAETLQRSEPSPAVEPLPPPEGPVQELLEMLERKKQVILYGPPGTGKTYQAERAALELVARHNFQCPPAQLQPFQQDRIYGRDGSSPYIALCTFHPMYSYEDFIEGYRPEREGFSLRPGIFRRLAAAAQAQPGRRFVLIIDEINRGNIPKIFGELITLLEPARRGRLHTLLPLSGDTLSVPDNLYIIGTMNTADRSILLLDTALRRRFGFKELLPEPRLLQAGRIGPVPLSVWLEALNRRLREHLGRDGRNLQVGHAYFMADAKPVTELRQIARIVREDLWPLLQEYCYEDPRALAAILAADQGGICDPDQAELRHELFEPGREADLIEALTAILAPEERAAADRAQYKVAEARPEWRGNQERD